MSTAPDGHGPTDALTRPIFVVAPPRAGASLVASVLATAPGTWTAEGGVGAILRGVPELDPADGRRSGRLVAEDCRPDVRERLRAHLRMQVGARRPGGEPGYRLFDASPRNALRVPFLHAAFPDATFVYVNRRPADALAESLVLWRTGQAVTYPALPGWLGPPWSFALVPGWQELIGRPLAEVVTEQWVRAMRTLVADLGRLRPGSWCVTDHEELVVNPRRELARLFGFLGIDPRHTAEAFGQTPRNVAAAGDDPATRGELDPYLARTEELAARARDWFAPQATPHPG